MGNSRESLMNQLRTRNSLLCSLALAVPTVGATQTYPPAWHSTSTYAIGDQVQLNGNVLRATHAVPAGGFKYDDWELWDVRANTTLLIGTGQTFGSLAAAWSYAQNARVTDGAYLHFYIDTAHGKFSENFSAPFSLDHGSGARISIMGDVSSNVTLNFTSSQSNGFMIDTGHCLAVLTNLTITASSGNYGLYAVGNATIGAITGVNFSGFPIFVYADKNASLTFEANTSWSGFVAAACEAYNGATVSFGIGFTLNGQLPPGRAGVPGTTNNAGFGLEAYYGGHISAPSCSIKNCSTGVFAHDFGRMTLDSGTIESNGTYGILADTGGQVSAENATITGNGTDILSASGAIVDAFQADVGSQNQGGSANGSYIFVGAIGNP